MDEKNKNTKVAENKKIDKKVEKKIEDKKPESKENTNKKFEKAKTNTNTKNKKDNKTKKNNWVASVIVVVVVLAIAALLTIMIVTTSDPKQSIDGLLNNLKAGDFEKAQEFLSGETLLSEEDYDLEVQKLFFENLSWKITNIDKQEDTATATVEVTNKDFNTVVSNYAKKALEAITSLIGTSSTGLSNEQIQQYFVDELKNQDIGTTTQTGTIELVKEDKKWKVVSNEQLIDTLLPGLQEALDSVS